MSNAVIGALRVSLGLDSAQFDTGIKQVQSKLGGLGKLLSGAFVVGGLSAFGAGIGAAVGRIEEMRKLSAQLDRALTNTGNTARTSAAEVEAFADKLERSTGRAAEEVMAVSTNLATFGFGNEQFFRSISLANDMAAAWGGDLKQNIEGLGRALADPEKGLAMLVKRGITFDDQQKRQIANFMKVNDLAGAQGVIFEALEGQVKGVAEAGFGGLTKAGANVVLAVEHMFEAIASGLRVGTGLEMALVGIAAGVDFVTANIGFLGKVAGVAGTALTIALGPTVWAGMKAAAIAFGTGAKTAILGLWRIIAAHPIGFVITALAAAVAGVFLFRDEIKQVLGVDLAGIIIDIGNKIIGTFVGAYRGIVDTWEMLPAAFSDIATRAVNGMIGIIKAGLAQAVAALMVLNVPGAQLVAPGALQAIAGIGYLDNPNEGAAGQAGNAFAAAFGEALNGQYIEGFVNAVTGGMSEAGAAVAGFSDLVATGATDALDGAGRAGTAAAEAIKAGMDGARDGIRYLVDAIGSGLSSALGDATKALIRGEDAVEKLISGFGRLGDRLINMGADQLIQGILKMIMGAFAGGVGGGGRLGLGLTGANVYGGTRGFYGIPGFAKGGITDRPAIFGEGRLNEAAVPLPDGRSIPVDLRGAGAGPSLTINITGSKQDAAAIAEAVRKEAWDMIERHARNPYDRP